MQQMTRDSLWRWGADQLQQAGIENYLRIAQDLYLFTENISRMALIVSPDEYVSQDNLIAYQNYISRASQKEPFSKITQMNEFAGLDFYVTHDTLDPRMDTEILYDMVVETLQDNPAFYKLLDIGTGTGCIAISLAKKIPHIQVLGLDISEKSVIVAQKNANHHDVQTRCFFLEKDIFAENSDICLGDYDIIVSNPPYIPEQAYDYLDETVTRYDPAIALFAGDDGLCFYRNLAHRMVEKQDFPKMLFLEFGIGQGAVLKELFSQIGFHSFIFRQDGHGIIRALSCIYG